MVDEWSLLLPFRRPPLSLNQHQHWTVTRKAEADLRTAAWALARKAKIPELRAIMVELVWFKGDNRKADADNMAPTLKPLQDGLVLAHVVPDDNGKHVLRASQRVVLRAQDLEGRRDPRLYLKVADASVLADWRKD